MRRETDQRHDVRLYVPISGSTGYHVVREHGYDVISQRRSSHCPNTKTTYGTGKALSNQSHCIHTADWSLYSVSTVLTNKDNNFQPENNFLFLH